MLLLHSRAPRVDLWQAEERLLLNRCHPGQESEWLRWTKRRQRPRRRWWWSGPQWRDVDTLWHHIRSRWQCLCDGPHDSRKGEVWLRGFHAGVLGDWRL